MTRPSDRRTTAYLLASAVFLQSLGLVALDRMGPRPALQTLAIGLTAALAVYELWRHRRRLDHHLDMLLVMLAFGGLGMLLGTAIDRTPDCCRAGMSYWATLRTWMTALMLLGGIPASLFLTRCAALARGSARRWLATHVAGNLGMLTGMILAGKLLGHAVGLTLGLMQTGHHLAMTAGMLAGMTAAQLATETALGLRPWRRIAPDFGVW